MKKYALMVLMSACMATSFGQTTITDIIKTMPQGNVPYLSQDQLKELSHDADIRISAGGGLTEDNDTVLNIKNKFGGTTYIEAVSSSYIKLTLNETSCIELKLLTSNNSNQIICAVQTINKPVRESEVKFYDTAWRPVNREFGLINLDADAETLLKLFVARPDTMAESEFDELCKLIEPVVVCADLSTDGSITYKLSLPFVPHDKKGSIENVIRQKTFKWDGNMFKIG